MSSTRYEEVCSGWLGVVDAARPDGWSAMRWMCALISPYGPTHWHLTPVLARTKGQRTAWWLSSSSTYGARWKLYALRQWGHNAFWRGWLIHRYRHSSQQRWPFTQAHVLCSTFKLNHTHMHTFSCSASWH